MAHKPPPLPHEILSRVLNVATFDGRLLMIVASSLALWNAASHQPTGALIGVLVAGTGALELHGAGLLRSGDSRGMDWLVRSQLLLLATMLIYAAVQLMRPAAEILAELQRTPEARAILEQSQIPPLQLVQLINVLTYGILGLVTLIYQGWMALYYHRSRAAVTTALDEELFDVLNERD